jgi:hypothetical protein
MNSFPVNTDLGLEAPVVPGPHASYSGFVLPARHLLVCGSDEGGVSIKVPKLMQVLFGRQIHLMGFLGGRISSKVVILPFGCNASVVPPPRPRINRDAQQSRSGVFVCGPKVLHVVALTVGALSKVFPSIIGATSVDMVYCARIFPGLQFPYQSVQHEVFPEHGKGRITVSVYDDVCPRSGYFDLTSQGVIAKSFRYALLCRQWPKFQNAVSIGGRLLRRNAESTAYYNAELITNVRV